MLTSNEIRSRYLEFFKKNGHVVIPSAPLVPENDPTTLFTGSGMQPLITYLLGKDHPMGKRIVDAQKCFRSGDIEEVGDNRHTTFFEMLGNWSLGDYFKHEQLPWVFEFLTKEIGIDPNKLYVTVFFGDEKNAIPRDMDSVLLWKELFAAKGIDAKDVLIGSEEDGYQKGMQGGRIFYYNSKKNWWSRAGVPEHMPGGEPGGPDSEIFYDFGTAHDTTWGPECHPNCDCGRFLEIGNSVFMQYVKQEDGSFTLLPKQNVDFGGGLERLAMAATNLPDIIAVNHRPILDHLEAASGKTYGDDGLDTRAFRIVADHMKAAVFLIADGVHPGNTDQGYFVRRLIRRGVRYADQLGIKSGAFAHVVRPIAEMYKEQYADLGTKAMEIEKIVRDEEEKFRVTLEKGIKEIEKIAEKYTDDKKTFALDATILFDLYQTHGFPVEMSIEEMNRIRIRHGGIHIPSDIEKRFITLFKEELKKHQDLSRSGSEQKFKGGLADHSEMSVKYHTATHLLHKALQSVLGPHALQKGSNITPERLRFDFAHSAKMTEEEKKKVEDLVNEKITEALPVSYEDLLIAEAEQLGAIGLFEEKYGDRVRVYRIGEGKDMFSFELCGGPHVKNTNELGHFKIIKEEACSQGVRRIKAILE